MKPSTARVLGLLRDYGPIGVTHLDALERCHTSRLAARISELRADGFDVRTQWIKGPGQVRYALYVLVENEQLRTFG
jgi:DNA-binding HxlR family transcriptional regulator